MWSTPRCVIASAPGVGPGEVATSSAAPVPLLTGSVGVPERPQEVPRIRLDLGQLGGAEGALPGAHGSFARSIGGVEEGGPGGGPADAQEIQDAGRLTARVGHE